MIYSETTYRILYAHTDKMGVVYNGTYFEFFEAGRNDFLRKAGYPYKNLEAKDIALPVIEAHCNYLNGAKYDDEILIRTTLRNVPTVRIQLDYEIFVNETKIVTGYTVHSFVDAVKFRPIRPPSDFVDLIKQKLSGENDKKLL